MEGIVGKLAKISSEAKISGVCAGLARYSGIDVTIIRFLFVIAFFAGVGSPGIIYFVLSFLMPDE